MKKKLKKVFSKHPVYVFLIAIGVVMVWRSLWNLIDHYVFPHNFLLSNIITLVVGLLILWIPDKDIDELL